MSRASCRLFFPLLLFCLLASSLRAQRPGAGGTRSPGGIIDVQVRYADGKPAPRGIHVRLESAEGGAEADQDTIQGGKCQFHQNTSGVFIVRIAEGAYKEVSSRVELINSPRAYVTLDLIPLKKEPTPEVSVPPTDPTHSISAKDLAVPEPARQEFDKGEEALHAKHPDEGIKHFQKAVKLYDNYPQAYRMLGEAYLEQQDWQNAESALKKSIELEPRVAATYVDLGAVENQQHNYPAAEEALKKGLALSPDASAGKYELAKTYWSMGRWQDAIPLAQEAVAAQPNLSGARVLLGNLFLKERNAAAALREYEEYLRLEPNGSMAPQVREIVAKIKAVQTN
jgi:tetratricopeptide (TPR) repeat protein